MGLRRPKLGRDAQFAEVNVKLKRLQNTKVAMLVSTGFEEIELTHARGALEAEGAEVELISTKKDAVRARQHNEDGSDFPVDVPIAKANPDDYYALVIPGGLQSAEFLRLDARVVEFVRHFADANKPISAIGHAPWLLIEAGIARDRRLTSYSALRTDLTNAGATWVDQPVVVDENLVTSRWPDDIDAFVEAMLSSIAERVASRRRAEMGAHT